MVNSNLNIPREKIVDFCLRHHVKRLSLFGSATRADFRPDSDIDVLIEFDNDAHTTLFDLVGMQGELSVLFDNRPVDVATTSILRNPFRRRTILRDLQAIYGLSRGGFDGNDQAAA